MARKKFLTTSGAYTHPANHTPSIITQDTNNRFVSDVEKNIWNAKQDGLVSSINIKTINGNSILGNGNISIVTDNLLQDYYRNSNFLIGGGGTISFSSQRLKWTSSFSLRGNGRGATTSSGGAINITMPTSGTVTSISGASQHFTADGIYLEN